MLPIHRRRFLQGAVGVAGAAAWGAGQGRQPWLSVPAAVAANESTLHLAPFRFDVTPPKGHSCCGGWIKPIEAVDDPLEAVGFVLLGAGDPIVICAVDWTGILNSAHLEWRQALAAAAGTTPDRVAVQCVHQHNAPMACLDAERLVAAQGDLPHIVEFDFFRSCLERGQSAIKESMSKAERVTHIGQGAGRVEQVASNRRVNVGPDGRVLSMRGSACADPVLRDLPEGLIDPWLKSVVFYGGERKLATCYYYATHPMSYYGDGRASSDFVGLARKRRQVDEPGTLHLYFTGCAGNIAAGKYNNGTKEMRPVLTDRIYRGMLAADEALAREPVGAAQWRTAEVLPPPRATLKATDLESRIANKSNPVVGRNRPAYELAWLQRVERKAPLILSALQINNVSLLHLPSECFIEYQLRAQETQSQGFVATAAYGDGGPWYIPTREAYPQGGYEVSVAFCEPQVDDDLTQGIKKVLA